MADITDRDTAIKTIRKALKERSGKSWSVTGGRGTAWGWITIQAPPRRRDRFGSTSPQECAELQHLLQLDYVHDQGVSIPASSDYRKEYVARARGETPEVIGRPYWD